MGSGNIRSPVAYMIKVEFNGVAGIDVNRDYLHYGQSLFSAHKGVRFENVI